MILVVGSIVIQALLIVHCIKTGRNTIWIWVIALLSYAGIVAYVAVELLPDLFRSRTAQRTVRGVKKAMDPGADLRRYEEQARLTGNVSSRQKYAEELVRQGRGAEAVDVYRQALTGLYEHDPDLLLGLARAQFQSGQPGEARATLDRLIAKNPEFRSPEGHLLYARALESEGDRARALDEYRVLAGYYPGAEAAVRYAQLLRSQDQRDEARKALTDLLDQARAAPPHYRRVQEDWLKQAERELSAL
ncbi:MAG: tetratricopeptide repeat protein [Steroidobacteraceae bacterium]